MGDGTTSVVVLAGELLREAEKLVSQKIHPMTIISGRRPASMTTTLSTAALSIGAQGRQHRWGKMQASLGEEMPDRCCG